MCFLSLNISADRSFIFSATAGLLSIASQTLANRLLIRRILSLTPCIGAGKFKITAARLLAFLLKTMQNKNSLVEFSYIDHSISRFSHFALFKYTTFCMET
jgi:hypothetical protein